MGLAQPRTIPGYPDRTVQDLRIVLSVHVQSIKNQCPIILASHNSTYMTYMSHFQPWLRRLQQVVCFHRVLRSVRRSSHMCEPPDHTAQGQLPAKSECRAGVASRVFFRPSEEVPDLEVLIQSQFARKKWIFIRLSHILYVNKGSQANHYSIGINIFLFWFVWGSRSLQGVHIMPSFERWYTML